eukprot:TRINITY_DN5130_c0_g7_i1.p1 TRINITY_DN5130_c0_g7~~TRINITY_DN5130_c0_g7_i1.p1  ORF type:complete len:332 (+),score=97.86 TRINITY_DN5130_c0_g7_i1:467-1462(+)
MITGAACMDIGILVVSAEEGPMFQTREHLLLCKQAGVKDIVVYLNKADLVKDDEMFELLKMEIVDLMDGYGFVGKNAMFVRGSALAALEGKEKEIGEDSIAQLLDILDTKISIPERDLNTTFMMNIDGMMPIIGRGVVATGTIVAGKIKAGEMVEIIGMNKPTKRTSVSSLEIFRKTTTQGEAGDSVGLLLRGLVKGEITRGQCISVPGHLKCLRNFDASVYVLTPEEGGRNIPFRSRFKPQCFIRTGDVPVSLTLPEKKQIAMPGDKLDLKCKLDKKMPISPGTRFALREGNKTVAVGIINAVHEDFPEDLEADQKEEHKRGQKAATAKA